MYNLHTFDICLPGNAGPGTDKTNPREDKCVTLALDICGTAGDVQVREALCAAGQAAAGRQPGRRVGAGAGIRQRDRHERRRLRQQVVICVDIVTRYVDIVTSCVDIVTRYVDNGTRYVDIL